MYEGYFDGSANPNPGELGLGAVLYDPLGQEVDWSIGYKKFGTNNIAEYLSVIMLLKRAISLDIKELKCHGDSQLIINQLNGKWACNADDLKPLYMRVKVLAEQFNQITFQWVKRDKNKRADELSKSGVKDKKFSHMTPSIEPQTSISQPASNHSTAIKTTTKSVVRVQQIIGNRLLISEDNSCVVFNVKTRVCSCGEFHRVKQCRHSQVFQKAAAHSSVA